LTHFQNAAPNNLPTITNEQLLILERLSMDTKKAITPLQRLEHIMHPLVAFFVIPLFALANAGVTFLDIDLNTLFENNVALGVALGLLLGKIIGIVGFTWISTKLKIASLPTGMNIKNLFGLALLASIGFTMSLFITQLAFDSELYRTQAKIGIFVASIIGGVSGYFLLKSQGSKKKA
ncbi:MAG TPA: Na+/H+ antiporter NhaA, partial [Flavobacterium sp.]|nr:Na+/H+ antiporter NhaA [Flavobacterium sp.]